MITTHPQAHGNVNDELVRCIETCLDCAQVCTACADACMGEQSVEELTQCIRLDLDCAELCSAVARIASRRTGGHEDTLRRLIDLCADLCRQCGDECRSHAQHHRHCEICAAICRECEAACRTAAVTFALPRQ